MMVAFDLESTGTSVENDRIVTACLAYVDGAGKMPPETREWLAWPGMDIPAEATNVHGITTAHAKEHGRNAAEVVRELARELAGSAAGGVPVVGFNLAYDLTLLDRETRRHELDPLIPELESAKVLVVDPFVIDKAIDPYRKGKRTLGAVAEHYGVKAGEAHNAAGDAITAARVAWRIASLHPEIAQMSPTELHAFQVKARKQQAMSLRDYLRRTGKGDAEVDGSWPWRPWSGEEAAA